MLLSLVPASLHLLLHIHIHTHTHTHVCPLFICLCLYVHIYMYFLIISIRILLVFVSRLPMENAAGSAHGVERVCDFSFEYYFCNDLIIRNARLAAVLQPLAHVRGSSMPVYVCSRSGSVRFVKGPAERQPRLGRVGPRSTRRYGS